MPTKKKRVGFIPREDVMRIIDKLSMENNLSNSKIISILVEEALSIRGIFNKNNDKVTQSYLNNIDHTDDSAEFINNTKFLMGNRFENNFNSSKSYHLNEPNQEDFDLHAYKKFLSFL